MVCLCCNIVSASPKRHQTESEVGSGMFSLEELQRITRCLCTNVRRRTRKTAPTVRTKTPQVSAWNLPLQLCDDIAVWQLSLVFALSANLLWSLKVALACVEPRVNVVESSPEMLCKVSEDEQGACQLASNPQLSVQTKCFVVKFHFFWQLVHHAKKNPDGWLVVVAKHLTDLMNSNCLTEGLAKIEFNANQLQIQGW